MSSNWIGASAIIWIGWCIRDELLVDYEGACVLLVNLGSTWCGWIFAFVCCGVYDPLANWCGFDLCRMTYGVFRTCRFCSRCNCDYCSVIFFSYSLNLRFSSAICCFLACSARRLITCSYRSFRAFSCSCFCLLISLLASSFFFRSSSLRFSILF